MEDFNLLQVIVTGLFNLLTAIIQVILAPLDFLINALLPGGHAAVNNFFGWVNSMLTGLMDFFTWFLYVLGITPATWSLIVTVLSALLLIWIVMFPVRLIISVMKGMNPS